MTPKGDDMSVTENAATFSKYAIGHDESQLTDDAVYTDMNSGQQSVGREQIAGMLHWVYSVAFDATFEETGRTIDEEYGAVEGVIVGRHIGEFAGVPASNRDVRIPMAVVYRFRDGKIAAANIYMAAGAFMAQVTGPA
jgi:ketosteroid isomerase-like protein